MKGVKVKFLQAAPRADLRPSLETPPCAVDFAGVFPFIVAGVPGVRPEAATATPSHGGDLYEKFLSSSILLRIFSSLKQPIIRRAVIISRFDAHTPEHCQFRTPPFFQYQVPHLRSW